MIPPDKCHKCGKFSEDPFKALDNGELIQFCFAMTEEEKKARFPEGSQCAWLCKQCSKKFENYKHLTKEEALAKVK